MLEILSRYFESSLTNFVHSWLKNYVTLYSGYFTVLLYTLLYRQTQVTLDPAR